MQMVKARYDGEEWQLDILAIPFGSTADRDADGEYFDEETETHEDLFGLPPVVHYHGYADAGGKSDVPEYIGRTVRRWRDTLGVWFRARLDKGSARARELWEAARKGTLRASSGSISHLTRKDPGGHIREWPIVEVSLLDVATGKKPANHHAVAVPVAKAVYAKAGMVWPTDRNPLPKPAVTPRTHAEKVAEARARAYAALVDWEG